jgi:NADPH:quinone reductase-like Zn-dependent oxidoreductase
MRAVVLHEHGGIDKLTYEEHQDPVPGPDEVLVRVRACGVNHLDLLTREGRVASKVPLPHIMGSEVAGEVVGFGPHVRGLEIGASVAVATRLACGRCEYCVRGEENICLISRAIGLEVPGGYAELMAAPVANCVPLPPGMSFRDSAAFTLAGLTAWHMLVTRARLKPGEDVLVIAAGSGVGSAAIQIAKLMGARVIATAGTDDKLQLAKDLGADEVINHRERPFDEDVRRITGKRGVDVVFEHVGAATWERSINALGKNGRLVTCGAHTGSRATLEIWRLFTRQISLIGSYLGTKGERLEVLRLIGLGRLRPVIHAVLPLARAGEAHRILEERRHFGKLLLEP